MNWKTVHRAHALIGKILHARDKIKDIHRIVVIDKVYGHIEGGRHKDEPVGGKTEIRFDTEDEFKVFKTTMIQIWESRIAIYQAELSALGVTEEQ